MNNDDEGIDVVGGQVVHRRDYRADDHAEKPWFDYSQLLSKYGVEIKHPSRGLKTDYLQEENRLIQTAVDEFYVDIYENADKINDLRKLLRDLGWWGNTTCSAMWAYMAANLDDNAMIKLCYPLFPYLWD